MPPSQLRVNQWVSLISTMPKVKQSALGKSIKNKLMKGRVPETHIEPAKFYQPAEEGLARPKLQSRLQQDNIQQYVQEIQLQDKKYQATRGIKLGQLIGQTIVKLQQVEIVPEKRQLKSLRIPRRPRWTREMAKGELMKLENEAFLEWRRHLAQFEQLNYQVKLTPFQKNIQVWRQLWRVVQQCQLLVQVVDARDPLFFRCQDLEAYVREVDCNKNTILLLNKSDLIPEPLRKQWSAYFNEHGVKHCFYSAKLQQPHAHASSLKEGIIPRQLTKELAPVEQKVQERDQYQPWNLIGKQQLIQLFQKLRTTKSGTVGMVGFPNVGKSSVINSLIGAKKMHVGPLPGKTKHMQTFRLAEDLVLCDCPGLVFPSSGVVFGEMVLNGVIHLDNLRDYISAIALLVRRIPKNYFQSRYGLNIKVHSAQGLLQAYGLSKGLITGRGLPNQAFSARYLLKDYVEGRLIYCVVPPGSTFQNYQPDSKVEAATLVEQQVKKQERLIDDDFFQPKDEQIRIIVEDWTKEDLVQLLQGKEVHGVRLHKQARRQLKFGLKRGDPIQKLLKDIAEVNKKGKKK